MKKNRFKIKEFSLLCQVTVKTLRHYEKIGLLKPNEVDAWTGYRYYDVAQMQTLLNIRRLKSMGFSLDEILELYADGNISPSPQLIDEKIESCLKELDSLTKRLSDLRSVKASLGRISDMEKFEIQSLPEIIVASHREVIPSYADIGYMCYAKIGPEMIRVGCKCPEPGYCFTVDHNEYRATDIDIEYCEQVLEKLPDTDIIKFKTLEAVPKALCMKHVGPYERFYESFTEVFRYMEDHGYKLAGQPRTSYVDGAWNQEDPEKWISVIQIPIEDVKM